MLEWIITSCALILIVIALRCLLRGRICLRLQYALWALVLVRLLVPLSFGASPISVLNTVPDEVRIFTSERVDGGAKPIVPAAAPIAGAPRPQSRITPAPVETGRPSPILPGTAGGDNSGDNGGGKAAIAPFDLKKALAVIWLAGAAAVLAAFLAGNIRTAKKLKKSRRRLENADCDLPVYVSDALETPCLFGLISPAIYVTGEAAADDGRLRHVIAHERTHARHLDHIFSALRGLCLALHWYNPLVWLAASLSRRDQELACDEAAIARIGEAERAEYGKTLISLTCRRPSGLLLAATTMTASKGSLRERVALIAKKPRMTGLMLAAVIVAAAIAIGCTFTGASKPRETDGDGEKQPLAPTTAPTGAPTEAPSAAPTDTPAPVPEKLAVPVYPDYELLLENTRAQLGKDGCANRNSGPHTLGIDYLTFMFPTDALRTASSGEEYLIFDSERGYREYVFIDRDNGGIDITKGFPIVIGKLQPHSAFEGLTVGDPIEAVERIDPVAALHRQAILEVRQIHPETAKKYCVGYNALASVHYLTDGILKIEYEMPAEGELVISKIIYSPDYTLTHFHDIEMCYRIEPIDLPERDAEPGDIELVSRYNEREVAMLSAFFDTVDDEGRTNGSKISGEYVSGEPETWGPYVVHWVVYAGERHVYDISFDRAKVVGELNVSRFPALESLGCSETKLDSINASSCPLLDQINCGSCGINSLDITDCPALTILRCGTNALTRLELSSCPALKELDCSWNELTELELSGCPLLEKLDCSFNKLPLLALSGNAALASLACKYNELTELELSGCSSLTELICFGNPFNSLALSGCSSLEALYIQDVKLDSLDVSGCTALSRLNCSGMGLKTLNVSGCTALTMLYCQENELTQLELSGCTALTELICVNNDLSELNISSCTALAELVCSGNRLASLDVSSNTSLIQIACGNNALTGKFDLSNNPTLVILDLRQNSLSELNVSGCGALEEISCHGNGLSKLDITYCARLSSVDCRNNRLSSVDCTGCPVLDITTDAGVKLIGYHGGN
ncbi:MAG: hypothetical protein II871_06535 [Clostridia bacterium]|nr:hypothetical protein [Clostridia bacterium]